jgi:hypothetical protein
MDINDKISQNRFLLLEKLIGFLNDNFNNYNKLSFHAMNDFNLTLDKQRIIEFLKKSFDEESLVSYDNINGIIFRLNVKHQTDNELEEFNLKYISQVFEEFEQIFKDKLSHTLLGFNCFEEVVVENQNRKKFLMSRRGSVYNYTDWVEFFISYYKEMYSDYTFQNKKGMFTFTKKINSKYSWQLSINSKFLISEIKRGNLLTPDVNINLIDVTNDEINYLGILKNPFFRTVGLINFIAKHSSKKIGENHFEFINETKEIQVDENHVKFFNTEEIGDVYKKYAYMILNVNFAVEKVMLDFYEETLTLD